MNETNIIEKSRAILFIGVILATICLAGCNPREVPGIKQTLDKLSEVRTKETDKTIKESSELQELDNVCSQIPLLTEFKFIRKSMSSHNPPALYYYYYSDMNFDKSDQAFTQYFTNNGWEISEVSSLNRTSSFKKDDIRVTIQFGGMGGDANYGITCKKSPR